jgi:FKBP-type peptidyl-prolyl cis-trans isomerase
MHSVNERFANPAHVTDILNDVVFGGFVITRTILTAVLLLGASLFASDKKDGPPPVEGKPTVTPSGLKYWDVKAGTGDKAIGGMDVTVHYTGWLTNGQKFDSSVDRGEPFTFRLGAGRVIKGWDEGVAGMKVGGKRRLEIPPDLGYGARGAGGAIPPNATLVFDVELLAVR